MKGTVEQFECDFTTTTRLHKIISTSIIMSSLQKYFSYSRCNLTCGINNIYFKGILNDWLKLIEKANRLISYDID